MKDIQSIQQFTEVDNVTQLSNFGLNHLRMVLSPGSTSILFRNDHFSTLYKHPESYQLFTMVTDVGYSSHAEIVWESLADVSGSNAEFFSGDFRPVGHAPAAGPDPSGPRTSSQGATQSITPQKPAEDPSSQEQSDADYAYALQLQYEEEQWSSQARDRRTTVPQRPQSGSTHAHQRGRRSVGQTQYGRISQGHDTPVDAPPPPYARASDSPAYSPAQAGGQFTHFGQEDRYPRNSHGRRTPAPVTTLPDRPKDRSSRDCVVM